MAASGLLSSLRSAAPRTPSDPEALLRRDVPPTHAELLAALAALTSSGAAAGARHERQCQAFAELARRSGDRTLFAPLARALPAADQRLRGLICELLPALTHPAEHEQLVAVLRSPDGALRAQAAAVVVQIGGRAMFDALADLALSSAPAVAAQVMPLLVAVGGHRAVGPLGDLLSSYSPDVRAVALRCLAAAECADRDTARVLVLARGALGDAAEAVRLEAVTLFASRCAFDDYVQALTPCFADVSRAVGQEAVLGLARFKTQEAVALLAERLGQGPSHLRLAAIDALEKTGTRDVLSPLADALSHKQLPVRVHAGQALVRLAGRGAIDLTRTVIYLLRSRDATVRRLAAEVAQRVADPHQQLWPKLVAFLCDEDWWVRERVMDALADMGGQDLVRYVVALLDHASDVIRRYAVDFLIRLHEPEALGALVRTATSDPDWLVSERALVGIGALRDARAVPHVLHVLATRRDLAVACLDTLAALGGREAAPHAAAALCDAALPRDARLAAMACLRALGDREQAAALRAVLQEPDERLQEAAHTLLSEWETRPPERPSSGAASPSSRGFLDQLLLALVEREGDDLLLAPDRPPAMKRGGAVVRLSPMIFTARKLESLLRPQLSTQQWEQLGRLSDVDFSYEIPARGLRFRVNVFQQLGGLAAVFRHVRTTIPDLDDLGLPPLVRSFAELRNGLVLVGGPTGSGKSTTLAALIGLINRGSPRHVITVEDPIEYVHHDARSLVTQRELGRHTGPLEDALRATLREDPDVILVGEMRDAATISFGVSAAETGHLVFGTIHTGSAATTVDRLINACPPGQQVHLRSMLAGCLRAVVCQYLHQRRDARGRCLSVEVMLNNEAVASLIRQGKTHQIPSVMATQRTAGMQLMDQELMRLAQEGKISPEDAFLRAVSKKDFEPLLAGPRAAGHAAH